MPADTPNPILTSNGHSDAELQGGWRPIETAPKDGTRVLLILKDPIPVPRRADLRNWDGRPFVGRHMGGMSEWCFAAPVGQGGFPDEWMAGWMPLPSPPREAAGPAIGSSQALDEPSLSTPHLPTGEGG